MPRASLLFVVVLLVVTWGCSTREDQDVEWNLPTFTRTPSGSVIMSGELLKAEAGQHGDMTCCELCIDIKGHLSSVAEYGAAAEASHSIDDLTKYMNEVMALLDAMTRYSNKCGGDDCCGHCAKEGQVYSPSCE